jgi:hypothetical protein
MNIFCDEPCESWAALPTKTKKDLTINNGYD